MDKNHLEREGFYFLKTSLYGRKTGNSESEQARTPDGRGLVKAFSETGKKKKLLQNR